MRSSRDRARSGELLLDRKGLGRVALYMTFRTTKTVQSEVAERKHTWLA